MPFEPPFDGGNGLYGDDRLKIEGSLFRCRRSELGIHWQTRPSRSANIESGQIEGHLTIPPRRAANQGDKPA